MRITRHSIQRPLGDRRKGIALALAAALLASPVAMGVAPGDVTGLVSAQQQRGGPVQVVAQGIAKLPKGNLAWTVRRLDAPGDPGASFAAFPVGFVLADGGTIALANEDGDVLELLGDGEAAFLPAGKGGAASSEDGEGAGLYEIALIAADQAATGQDVGTVAGTPFAPPKGDAFDLELMRASLENGQEANVPAARSGAPVFFLQTNGVSELQTPDGQTAQLSAGQFALLQGDILVRGASDEAASFVVAAIGDTAAKKAKADGTPEARAGKNKGNKAGGGGGGGGGRGQAAGAASAAGGVAAGQQKDKKNRGQGGGGGKNGGQSGGATGGGGGTAAPQETGGTPVAEPTVPTPATPPVEAPQDAATPPAEATPPSGTTDGTPATDEVTDDEVVVEEIVSDDETTTEDESPPDEVTPEATESEQPTDTESEETPVGDTTDEIVIPVEETDAEAPAETTVEEPAADVGAETAPAEEPVVDITVEEPVVEAPVEEAPAEQIVPVEQTPAP